MITIVPARGDLRQQALTLLYSRLPRGERENQLALALDAVARGELPLDDLMVAEQDGRVIGAVLAVRQPGDAAFLWPPVVVDSTNQQSVADALLQAVGRRLDDTGILFTQVLLEREDVDDRELLARNGFPQAADLLFLHRDLTCPLPMISSADLQVIPYDETRQDQFAWLLERTYIDSRDCPELTGLRGGEESLAAHHAAGSFAPGHWLLYRDGDVDVGVLLLSQGSDATEWEIIYFGVVPEARGRGYGRAIAADGLHRARAAGGTQMQLTVDSGNAPAISVYESLGFSCTAIRAVHLRINATLTQRR